LSLKGTQVSGSPDHSPERSSSSFHPPGRTPMVNPAPAFERQGPPGVRGSKAAGRGRGKMKGKGGMVGGKKEMYDLIVNIDLEQWKLSDQQVADYKEVFMLFDRDEDGVLSFTELQVVMKSLGQRPSEEELLSAVREVSEDYIYDTVEFNEFLQLMSKQEEQSFSMTDLLEAFRLFDEDDDGLLTISELSSALTQLGDPLTNLEVKQMLRQARFITENVVVEQDDDSKCESSEEPSKADGSEALPKAVITEEAINYKEFVKFMCKELNISVEEKSIHSTPDKNDEENIDKSMDKKELKGDQVQQLTNSKNKSNNVIEQIEEMSIRKCDPAK